MHTPPQARDDTSNFKFGGVPPGPSTLYYADRMKLQFLFRSERPIFWPAAGLKPDTLHSSQHVVRKNQGPTAHFDRSPPRLSEWVRADFWPEFASPSSHRRRIQGYLRLLR